MRFVRPYRSSVRSVYLLYFLNSALNLIPAYSVRFYVDLVLMNQPVSVMGFAIPPIGEAGVDEKIRISLLFAAGMLMLILGANTVGVVMWRLGTRNVESILLDIKTRIHDHINKLSLSYFNSERIGTIMTKAVGDVTNLSLLLRQSFIMVYAGVQFLLTPLLMLSLSPMLFLVVLATSPLIGYAFYSIRMRLKPLYRTQRENESTINSRIQEVISGIREIKAFNLEEHSGTRYRDANERYYDVQNRIMRVFSINHQLQYGTKDLTLVLIAVAGGILILTGTGGVTVGTILSFIALTGYLFTPISQFFSFFDVIQRGTVSLERIVDFLNVDPDVQDSPNARDTMHDKIRGEVEYRKVGFSYVPGSPVLSGVSFHVAQSEKVAVVGPSGSGKSTLLSLLPRFFDVTGGSILLDNIDVREYRQTALRSHIGIVFQETFLFYGTIRDNLRFINPQKTEDDIIAACKAANIWDTIREFPDGLETQVGERGVTLSGGQRQRLAIARVFLKDPEIVILDEATSAVDTVTERLIQQSIDNMLCNRTAFIIAHRLSTILSSDRILVLDRGEVVETGKHQELLDRRGMYYRLHESDLF